MLQLIKALPPFLRNVEDLQQLFNTFDIELGLVKTANDNFWKDQFIATATEYGIARREKLLGIRSSANDTLEFRRDRVARKYSSRPPFTIATLMNEFNNAVGIGHFKIFMHYSTYSLDFALYNANLSSNLVEKLYRTIPLNLKWTITSTLPSTQTIYTGCTAGVQYSFLTIPTESVQ